MYQSYANWSAVDCDTLVMIMINDDCEFWVPIHTLSDFCHAMSECHICYICI